MPLILQQGDDLFQPGDECSRAFFFSHGHLHYSQDPDTSVVAIVTGQRVKESSWLCEAALWMQWIHVGRAQAIEHCRLLTLDSDPGSRTQEASPHQRGEFG